MNRLFNLALVLAGLAVLLGSAGPAHAQTQQHTLVIRDGQVWINDQQVPPEKLPRSLVTEGVDAYFSFLGTETPMIEFGGAIYVLEDGGLRELLPAERPEAQELDVLGMPLPVESRARLGGLPEAAMDAQRLDQLERSYQQQLLLMQVQAAQAAEMARVLPRLQVQNYFSEVQQQDQGLYRQLVTELQMEAQARDLALEIQRLPEGALREQRIEALRQRLDSMFELKQENRRLEIRQLEGELEALYKHLSDREALRQRIVEQRLLELINQPRND